MTRADPLMSGLIERVRLGDETAAGEFVSRLQQQVERIVRAHLPRGEAPEDLAQEVFMRIFASLDGFRGDAPIEHWVSRLAVNVCIDRLRTRQRRPELRWSDLGEAGQETLLASFADPATEAGDRARDARELVERLLASLKPEQRLVIRLLELEGCSVAEIAALTGWSPILVRVRAFRARRQLKQTLTRLSLEACHA